MVDGLFRLNVADSSLFSTFVILFLFGWEEGRIVSSKRCFSDRHLFYSWIVWEDIDSCGQTLLI
jgi:hypothetical protein